MRLEPLCQLAMRYTDASRHRPYRRSAGEPEQGLSFGRGEEDAPGHRRPILARVELTTEAATYRWLDTCSLVGGGEIDEEREVWWLHTHVCQNEGAHGPPAIGEQPPARSRQRGR